MNLLSIPRYIDLPADERGQSLGLSHRDFRHVAITALSITHALGASMAVYKTKTGTVVLDMFCKDHLLMITVASAKAGDLGLFITPLDSTGEPQCLLLAEESSEESWHALCMAAKEAIKSDDED